MKVNYYRHNDNTTIAFMCMDLPYSSIFHYIDVGTKDDIDYTHGVAHLAEHLIVNEMKKKFSYNAYCFLNGIIEKDYTCIYGMIAKGNEKNMLSQFINFDFKLTDVNQIEKEKRVIYDIEDTRTKNNDTLMNILELERGMFNNSYSESILCENNFLNLGIMDVNEYIAQKYILSSHFIIIFTSETVAEQLIRTHHLDKISISNGNIKRSNYIQSYNTAARKNNIFCMKIEAQLTLHEYFALGILMYIYKIYLNKIMFKYNNYITNIFYRPYISGVLIFIESKESDENIANYMKEITFNDFIDLIIPIKEHYYFSYMKKITDCLKFSQELFKCYNYYNKIFDVFDLKKILDMVDYNYLNDFNNRIINFHMEEQQ